MQPSELFANLKVLLWQFLNFQVFITPSVLITCYYFGALIVPFLLFYFLRKTKAIIHLIDLSGTIKTSTNSIAKKLKLTALFLVSFIMFQLVWRMLFEFLLAYYQIRYAIVVKL